MPKKSSSKKATQVPQNSVVEEEKPSSTKKKAPSEIDEIFAGIKRKKSEPEESGKPNEEATGNSKKIKKKNKVKMSADDGGFMDPPSRPRKKTNDGLAIYTEEELNISKADAGVKLGNFPVVL
ncbi:hypothetical protein F2P56_012254 [Juglans regia]|uniref:Uncharacterized protein n=1 Tax=Juglans regia TaxID=51240 RepID=A0A833XLC0_JUGRE|nr:hypothetical protein F2P56_012254 [Juglans regia]